MKSPTRSASPVVFSWEANASNPWVRYIRLQTGILFSFIQIPNDQHVVLAVRLLYGSWENTVGMPAQIMLRATRAGVQTKDIVEEIQ